MSQEDLKPSVLSDEGVEELFVLGDFHVAEVWDRIDGVLKKDKIALDWLNPNEALSEVVDTVNDYQGKVAVVLNGDKVDYHFVEYEGIFDLLKRKFGRDNKEQSEKRPTNWDLLHRITGRLRAPCHSVPGNHDFRSEAYNFGLYGLKHVGIPDVVRKKIAKAIGFHRFRWFDELRSILVNERVFNPLDKSSAYITPTERQIGAFRCVFLNSGSDSFVRPRNILRHIKKFLYGGGLNLGIDGFTEKDIEGVQEIVDRRSKEEQDSTYFFVHGPIINVCESDSAPGKKYQLDPDNFLKSVSGHKLAHETILNGGGEFLEVLRNSEVNAIIIASHVHHAKYFVIDKQSFEVMEVTLEQFNQMLSDPRYIKQATTLPLGAVDNQRREAGYLRVTKEGLRPVVVKRIEE